MEIKERKLKGFFSLLFPLKKFSRLGADLAPKENKDNTVIVMKNLIFSFSFYLFSFFSFSLPLSAAPFFYGPQLL